METIPPSPDTPQEDEQLRHWESRPVRNPLIRDMMARFRAGAQVDELRRERRPRVVLVEWHGSARLLNREAFNDWLYSDDA